MNDDRRFRPFKATHTRRLAGKPDEDVYAELVCYGERTAVYHVRYGKVIKRNFSASIEHYVNSFVPLGV